MAVYITQLQWGTYRVAAPPARGMYCRGSSTQAASGEQFNQQVLPARTSLHAPRCCCCCCVRLVTEGRRPLLPRRRRRAICRRHRRRRCHRCSLFPTVRSGVDLFAAEAQGRSSEVWLSATARGIVDCSLPNKAPWRAGSAGKIRLAAAPCGTPAALHAALPEPSLELQIPLQLQIVLLLLLLPLPPPPLLCHSSLDRVGTAAAGGQLPVGCASSTSVLPCAPCIQHPCVQLD